MSGEIVPGREFVVGRPARGGWAVERLRGSATGNHTVFPEELKVSLFPLGLVEAFECLHGFDQDLSGPFPVEGFFGAETLLGDNGKVLVGLGRI